MIVCVCNRVSDRDIARAVDGGCASFEELQAELRVGTRCGACRRCAQSTFDRQLALQGGDCACAPVELVRPAAVRRSADAFTTAAA
jgi:bacterioferritin-associated ferredoxin